MKIGLDLDGVMYKWDLTAGYMLREVLPNSPYKDDERLKRESTHWNHIQEIVSPEHWKWLWSDGVRLGLFRHGHLYRGTIVAVRRLAQLGDIVVVTHRPKAAVPDTMAWLAYQQLPISGIHILTNQEPKSLVKDLDVFLDDKPENCEDMNENTKTVTYMMDRPWNQHSDYPWRVHSWQGFINVASRVRG